LPLGGIDGAQIVIDRDPSDNQLDFQTEADLFGFFEFESIPANTYQLIINHPGFAPFQEAITLNETGHIRKTIHLVPLSIDSVNQRL
jgi:hypothetical protein